MIFVKINETLYPAQIIGKLVDRDWDSRASKAITVEMEHELAASLFVDSAPWAIVERVESVTYVTDENGDMHEEVTTQDIEYDNSEYSIAGQIVDHRDGTLTVKMGKLTELEEAYELLFGGMLDYDC